MTLRADIISCSPRGFASPLSHFQTFQEPLEQRSGAANADIVLDDDGCSPKRRGGEVIIIRHPNYVSPGTFGKFEGKLRKASTRSSIAGMHWHNPAGQSRTKKHNPTPFGTSPTVKEREQAVRDHGDEHQRKAIKKLLKQHKIHRPRSAPPVRVQGFLPPPAPSLELIAAFKATRKPGETFMHWQHRTERSEPSVALA